MIVIPMAGMSKRFTDAGYAVPKYMLPLGSDTVFAHAVKSFRRYFDEAFLFVARDVADTRIFIDRECDKLGLAKRQIVMLSGETGGQAETVELGLRATDASGTTPLTIFNIDTFRKGFEQPSAAWSPSSSGYLEVFVGSGANWSYVLPVEGSTDPLVQRTAEKQQISNLCCNGLYHFSRADDFLTALEQERRARQSHELYIAPLYNHLIGAGKAIHYTVIEAAEVVFCGVPAEYRALLAQEASGS